MRKVLIAFKMILLIVISTSVMYADDIPPTNSIPMDKVISKFAPQFKNSIVGIGGHNDGTFNLPKPGLCISASWGNKENFEKTFPGWEVMVLKEKNERAMTSEFGDWRKEKNFTRGKWWHPGAKDHPEMVKCVDEWLSKWIGFAEETIFEVNMLSISPDKI